MGKLCIVSKKVTRDSWKVGFMLREELNDDEDSGWQFFAGDEDTRLIRKSSEEFEEDRNQPAFMEKWR